MVRHLYRKRVATYPLTSRAERTRVMKCLRRQIRQAKLRAIVTGFAYDNSVSIWATSRREAVKLIAVERKAERACKI